MNRDREGSIADLVARLHAAGRAPSVETPTSQEQRPVMNRHEKRRAQAIERRRQKHEKKLATRVGKMAESLAKGWVNEGLEKMRQEFIATGKPVELGVAKTVEIDHDQGVVTFEVVKP